jgi:hypothetical protein
MSSDIFHSDWYTDPPWDDVSLAWLVNYVKNIRTNPALSQAVSRERDQFEMVPMPKNVLDHLANSRRVSTVVGRNSIGSITTVNTMLSQFIQAVEAGKLEDAGRMLSANYRDAFGRDAKKVMQDLKMVLGGVSNLKVVPFSTDDLLVIGDRILANIQVAWQGDVKQGVISSNQAEAAHIELILEKDAKGQWSISSLRML